MKANDVFSHPHTIPNTVLLLITSPSMGIEEVFYKTVLGTPFLQPFNAFHFRMYISLLIYVLTSNVTLNDHIRGLLKLILIMASVSLFVFYSDFKLFDHISVFGAPNRLSWITNKLSPISPQVTDHYI